MRKLAEERSSLLYSVIDESNGFFSSPVEKTFRSRLTIPFRVGGQTGNEELEKKFLDEALAEGMIQLKGHRSVGGIRASLYNAMTVEEVQKLVSFMKSFQQKYQWRHHFKNKRNQFYFGSNWVTCDHNFLMLVIVGKIAENSRKFWKILENSRKLWKVLKTMKNERWKNPLKPT